MNTAFLVCILCHPNLVNSCFTGIIVRNGSNTQQVLGAIIILSLLSVTNVSEEVGNIALKTLP